MALAGLEQTLTLTMHLPGNYPEPAKARKALSKLAVNEVAVLLPGLSFRGHVVYCTFTELPNKTGAFSGADVTVGIQGHEE
jgi:hypothetical protein